MFSVTAEFGIIRQSIWVTW